ncbi:MAG: sulfotransferase [Solirubrobacteraceae bacterium]|jgi:hypothetical protein
MSEVNGGTRGPVCVLGFGRSGTSLTMRLLHLLGVDIGPQEDLLAPGEADNPRGYWEPGWMVALNDEILAKLGTVWWRPLPVAPGWERSADFDELRERASGLLEEKFGAAPLWGWKDPRTTLTLPFWKELVPDARYVICLRNPADAISSIQRRPDPELSIGAWGDLWLEYTARALRETQGCPRTLVFYEDSSMILSGSSRRWRRRWASRHPARTARGSDCSRRSSRGVGIGGRPRAVLV